MAFDLPPPNHPRIAIVQKAEIPTPKTQTFGNSLSKPPKSPNDGGHFAVGLDMNDEPKDEGSVSSGFFVTKLAERYREEHPEAIGTGITNSPSQFRTVYDAEAQIEADQELLKKTIDKDLRVGIAKRIDDSYRVLFELREKEKQGLASSNV